MKSKVLTVKAGRPRAFDIDKALDDALQVFWQKGYEGASLTDLTKAMGINRPSLYAAFGNKEALFWAAFDKYAAGPARFWARALLQPTARAVAEYLLRGSVDSLSKPDCPRGCLAVQGALSSGDEADTIRRELSARRAAAQESLCQRFEEAKLSGDLPPTANPADLARYITTLAQGMAVQAAGGASRGDLTRVVDMALAAWPH